MLLVGTYLYWTFTQELTDAEIEYINNHDVFAPPRLDIMVAMILVVAVILGIVLRLKPSENEDKPYNKE